jgi:hypothetical protein
MTAVPKRGWCGVEEPRLLAFGPLRCVRAVAAKEALAAPNCGPDKQKAHTRTTEPSGQRRQRGLNTVLVTTSIASACPRCARVVARSSSPP